MILTYLGLFALHLQIRQIKHHKRGNDGQTYKLPECHSLNISMLCKSVFLLRLYNGHVEARKKGLQFNTLFTSFGLYSSACNKIETAKN